MKFYIVQSKITNNKTIVGELDMSQFDCPGIEYYFVGSGEPWSKEKLNEKYVILSEVAV